ncbi:MAG: type II toxin-antitoxin system RelE/ParE family toxin [Campylobacterota bacterium]|nr:type II toxin-antitoxin system RelE/ParE family toxin [Campylobacterota bacterium]
MISVQLLELAQSELDDAFEAYEYQKKDLGYRFVQEVKNTFEMIKSYPDAWPKSSEHTQRCFIKGFPYGILYHKADNIIFILAIVNLRKKPIHWVSKSVSEYSTCRIPTLPETIYTR